MDSRVAVRLLALSLAMTVALLACAAPVENPEPLRTCTVTKPIKPVICTMQYEPVCGCDGKTYSNACTARAAGVSSSTPGACDDPGPR